MQALSGRPVFTSQWDARPENNMAHINLSRAADAIVIAPCSADFAAKLAQGRADELLEFAVLGAAARQALAAGSGHEPRNVGASGHAAQLCPGPRPMAPKCWTWARASKPVANAAMAACSNPKS